MTLCARISPSSQTKVISHKLSSFLRSFSAPLIWVPKSLQQICTRSFDIVIIFLLNLEAPPHDDTNKEKILDEMVDTLVIRTKTKLGVSYECRVCNKTLKEKNLIRRHAETHIKGFSHMCDYCGKFYKNRASLRVHMSISHKQCKTEELEDGHSSQWTKSMLCLNVIFQARRIWHVGMIFELVNFRWCNTSFIEKRIWCFEWICI